MNSRMSTRGIRPDYFALNDGIDEEAPYEDRILGSQGYTAFLASDDLYDDEPMAMEPSATNLNPGTRL